MIVGRIIGWALFLIGVGIAGHEIIGGLMAPEYRFIPLGELWFKLDAGSLNLIQAVVQRYIWAWLWDNVIFHILSLPAWVVFLVPGLILMLICRQRGGAQRRRWWVKK